MRKPILVVLLVGMMSLVSGAPHPVVAGRGDWEIVPGVLLTYSSRQWRADSATNELQNIAALGCALSLNPGRGIPGDWKQRVVSISRNTRRMMRTTYYDAQWRLQFAVYRYIRPTNLDYLNSSGILLTPPADIRRHWSYCRRTAESVLATARRVGN
ncbi:MAG: hypothetical protein KatS3mg053_3240 [Candidatus Roseilinea sp.]|nr:MAG: hypothetical protein KatS3mg053_3240 [Candidatus Roseilinea sp.]